MSQPNDLSRSLFALDQNSTIIAVVGLSQSSWLVGGVVPGIELQPQGRWRRARNGCLPCRIAGGMRRSGAAANITRIALAFEPGRENAAEIGREIEFLTVNPVLGPTRRVVSSRSSPYRRRRPSMKP